MYPDYESRDCTGVIMKKSADEIMEECRTGLVFPYHINHDLRQSERFYHRDYAEFHEHSFNDIIYAVNDEPQAFYLTEEDKEYYSKQELEVIETIKQKRTPKRIIWNKQKLGFYCPVCNTHTDNREHPCKNCGQLLEEY